MRRLVWAFGWVGVAIWSLLCAFAYGLLDLVGRLFMRSADAFSSTPETVEGIWKFFSFLHSFSTGAVVFVWAVVSLMILAVPWLLDRMIGSAPPGFVTVVRSGRQGGPERHDGPGDVIDLAPDQYSVTQPGRTPSGPGAAPRIPPRP